MIIAFALSSFEFTLSQPGLFLFSDEVSAKDSEVEGDDGTFDALWLYCAANFEN